MIKNSYLIRILGLVFIFCLVLMLIVGAFRQNIYDPKLGINILLVTKEGMEVVGIRADENLANYLVLPNNLMIQTSRGEYQVEGLWKVGLVGRTGLTDIRLGVGRTLGVVLGGVVKINGGVGVKELQRALLAFSSGTNLSLIDRIRLYADLGNLLKKGLTLEISLPQNTLTSFEEADGKAVVRPNAAVYLWVKNQWVNEQLLSEAAEVSVVNASGKEGLGRIVSRQLETAGVRVVDVGASEKVLTGSCILLGDKKNGERIFEFLKRTFNCRSSGESERDYVLSNVKSDLVMVLGSFD